MRALFFSSPLWIELFKKRNNNSAGHLFCLGCCFSLQEKISKSIGFYRMAKKENDRVCWCAQQIIFPFPNPLQLTHQSVTNEPISVVSLERPSFCWPVCSWCDLSLTYSLFLHLFILLLSLLNVSRDWATINPLGVCATLIFSLNKCFSFMFTRGFQKPG